MAALLRCLRSNNLIKIWSNELRILAPCRHYSDIVNLNSAGSNENKNYNFKFGIIGASIGIGTYLYLKEKNYVDALDITEQVGKYLPNLPTYKISDISKHSEKKDKIWVTYKRGVYDITNFIDKHPGGDKIIMAAGGSLEPFWLIYAVHQQPEILAMLEEYRIGNLDESEVESPSDLDDPYRNDPSRHPALKPSSVKPFNAEPPPMLLVDSFITPQELFYVRNHLPVPEIDEKEFELEIEGLGIKRTKTYKLADLKKLPKHTVTAAIQCAGNRRSEMTKVKPVKGLNWGHAVIGNATWTGIKLCDLLEQLGINEKTDASHVQFEGSDTDPANAPYGASIPITKAMDPNGDVILAYEMNEQPLSRDHGYPLRVIVPGVVGARNVKWLNKIIVSKEESKSHWQQNDYKGFSPSVDWDTVDFTKSPAIQELPVTSAVCSPSQDERVKLNNGHITIQGYAWSGGGREIVRVDLSVDKGQTWFTADLVAKDNKQKHPYHWGWTLWKLSVPIKKMGKIEIWAKAVDSSYNTQPEKVENIWNLRGVLSNAYHRVNVEIIK